MPRPCLIISASYHEIQCPFKGEGGADSQDFVATRRVERGGIFICLLCGGFVFFGGGGKFHLERKTKLQEICHRVFFFIVSLDGPQPLGAFPFFLLLKKEEEKRKKENKISNMKKRK